jgi:hypothetical protein
MKRKLIFCLVLVAMMLCFGGVAQASEVVIDGKSLVFDTKPAIINGRVLVPFRGIFEALGAEVQWYGDTGKIIAHRGNTTIEINIGGSTLKNGKPVSLDVPPRIIRGRTMVPIRFVSEALGAQVHWDKARQRVVIITGKMRTILYTWRYGGKTYRFGPVNLTEYEYQSILSYYRNKPHPRLASNYAHLSTYIYSYDPDGEKILKTLVKRLKELAEKEGIKGDRVVDFVVSFVQAFPYISDSVSTPYDDYTRYPIETLLERKGDCEDTALLIAVLLKELGYGSALIIMPEEGHAAAGVLGGENMYGTYYQVGNKKYFYLETTGTGWPIGVVPDDFIGARAIVVPL